MRIRITKLPSNTKALGGVLQSHGADWSNGLVSINAGGSHEENKYDGVQLGQDENLVPNLVEEGEVVFDDYVYSRRIYLDEETKKAFHISKNRDITYADMAKKLGKESEERPNDPITLASLKVQMQDLADQQERQKAEMEAEQAEEAFNALSDEEKVAVMQQMQQQAQQQAIMQEASQQMPPSPEEAAMMQQPVSPEEQAMAEQQMMQADGSPAALGQEAPMMAEGGRLYGKGGVLKLLNKLGYKTVAEAEKAGWKPSDFGKYEKWSDINADSELSDDFQWTDEFSKRLTTPEQRAALSLGWNPVASMLERKWYEGDNGNNVGWSQSYNKKNLSREEFNDYVKRYKNTLGWAVNNGVIKAPEEGKTISTDEIMKAMAQAPDWKKTDEWLYSDPANMASYLGMARGLNPDDDVKFTERWAPYGTFSKGEDGKWTFKLKEDADKDKFREYFRKARTDGDIGVMYNNFSDPLASTSRYLIDEEGNPTLITADDVEGYTRLGDYTWGSPDDNTNKTAIFYRAKNDKVPLPDDSAVRKSEEGTAENFPNLKPKYMKETNIGMLGPAVGLGLQLAGVGRPDTEGIDAAMRLGSGPAYLAEYQPIGDYKTYKPLDIWYGQNSMNAIARAADRTIMNSSLPTSTKYAALLANNYNSQLSSGNLFRQGLEYNDNLDMQTKSFNKDTNKFNADAFNQTSRFNADALNRQAQQAAQIRLQGESQKMDADAGWYNSLYGNIGGLFNNIKQWEKYKRDHNTLADMWANGLAGTVSEKTPVASRYVEAVNSAEGGRIRKKKHKKKGLTI